MLTLASDFGSPYPAAMKGVLRSAGVDDLVDVTHDLPRQDPRAAAFWLRFVLPEFPPAVHLVVVDPGVGTDRAALVVRAGDHALVGADNGALVPPARALAGTDGEIEAYAVAVDDPASRTFHGRDVFAPAAARVHEAGVEHLPDLEGLSRAEEYVDLAFPDPVVEPDRAVGEVLVVDDFGNAITNVPGEFLAGLEGSDLAVETPAGTVVAPAVETFAAVGPGEPLVTVGSHGYLECDVNRGRGDEAFGLSPGDDLSLSVA